MNKLIKTQKIVEETLKKAKRPVLLCSFGKDSMVLLHIMREIKPDIEIISFREPFCQKKFLFAQRIMARYDLRVYDYPPTSVDYVQSGSYFDVYYFYYINAKDYIILSVGCYPYDGRRNFLCAVNDFLNKPTVPSYDFKWDYIYYAQRESEKVRFFKKVKWDYIYPIKTGAFVLPIKDWYDKDIWSYINKNDVPYDKRRYKICDDKINPDIFYTCFDCLDYRKGKFVYCHKQNKEIKNIADSKEKNMKKFKFLGSNKLINNIPCKKNKVDQLV